MRGARWLLLVAIAAILGGIGFTYRAQKTRRRAQDPPRPAPLPLNLNSTSVEWSYDETDTKSDRPCSKIQIRAQDFKELKDTGRVDLKGVTLKAPSQDCTTYNLVKSSEASFFKNEHRLFSEGEVDVTLKVPTEGDPRHTLVSIHSSRVTLDTTSNHVETESPSRFLFENGDGTATGASYDPGAHALILKKDARLNWQSPKPGAPPMLIEGSSLEYNEAASQIRLSPWGRLTRGKTVVEGENSVIYLQDNDGRKVIRKVDSSKAHGTDEYPNRKLVYSADTLAVDFDESGIVRMITAQDHARLVSTAAATETEIIANHVELTFDTASSESVLTAVNASGNAVVRSSPLAGASQPAETHVLKSEQIEMQMRPGGREIQTVVARAPGTLEFLPNLPVQHHRILEGKDMVIAYGAENRIESFKATAVRTTTEPNAEERKKNRANSITTSRDINARFDPQTNKLATMEQQGDFAYEEGDRRAKAAKATLDSARNVILLETGARVWDPTGSTAADHIRLNQENGDFTAEGNVSSSRLPDRDEKKNSQMLSGDAPVQARARQMDSSNHNHKIHYQGGAAMWQGANRIQAETIDVDREKRTLIADGNVVSDLWETPKSGAAPVETIVRAPHLVYTEENRLAYYSGGSNLTRTGVRVKSKEIRAFLADNSQSSTSPAPPTPGGKPASSPASPADSGTGDSRLEKAIADGAVEIVQTSPETTRTGTADHAEYYTTEQKIFLSGGSPKMMERQRDGRVNTTEGLNLTYFAADDRLLNNGSVARQGKTSIQRKPAK
jgi:lipopolysaccharide export system protein LptA